MKNEMYSVCTKEADRDGVYEITANVLFTNGNEARAYYDLQVKINEIELALGYTYVLSMTELSKTGNGGFNTVKALQIVLDFLKREQSKPKKIFTPPSRETACIHCGYEEEDHTATRECPDEHIQS